MKRSRTILLAAIAVAAVTLSGGTYAFASSALAPKVPGAGPQIVAPQGLDDPGVSPRMPVVASSIHTDVSACTLLQTSLSNGHTRTVSIRGTGSLHAQGGSSTGCTIPRVATSVDVVITLSAGSHSGYLTWHDNGGTAYRVMSYPHGQTSTVTTKLQLAQGTIDGYLANSGSTSSAKIVVIGYDSAPLEGMISPTGAVYSGSTGILSATHPATGQWQVTMNQDVSYCTPTVTAYSGYVYASAYDFNGSTVTIYAWYLNSSTHAETAFDTYVYLSVNC